MPRFFFHIRTSDQSLSLDELGLDYPDVKTACREAVRAAEGLEEVFAARGENPRDFSLEVENASGETVARLRFSEIFARRDEALAGSPGRFDENLRDPDRMN
jgi:hypothetical protein